LDKGADVNAQGGEYGNALQAASSRGHQEIVQLLLDKGADVNAQGGEYGNALPAASWGGYQGVVQLLLDKGADVNAQGSHYVDHLSTLTQEGSQRLFHRFYRASVKTLLFLLAYHSCSTGQIA
jgi:ankyrin repeat protein